MKACRNPFRAGLFCLAVATVESAFAPEAFAYYPFPGYVEQHLGVTTLPAPPSGQYCELCHNNPAGGEGTATEPFGLLIKAQGIVYTSSESELDAALDAIRANPSTAGYIADIEAGENPNTDPKLTGATPQTINAAYGCGASIAPAARGRDSNVGALLVFAAAFALLRRACHR